MSPSSLHGQTTGSLGSEEERHGHRAQVGIGAKTEHPLRFLEPLNRALGEGT